MRPSNLAACAIVLLLLPAVAGTAIAAQTAAEPDALQVDAQRVNAMLNGDAVVLDRVLAADVTYVTAEGRLEDKQSLMYAATSKSRTYERYVATEQRARVAGTVAIVTGVAAIRGTAGKELFDIGARYTAVYVRRDARWQLAAYQETPLAPPGRTIGGESA